MVESGGMESQGLAFSMTCPCGPTRLEFKLWDRRVLLHGSRWNIEIAVVAFALFPASWHLSANQSDGQPTCREQRWRPQSHFVLVSLLVKEDEWHLQTPCLETQCFTGVMFCSLCSGKIMWRKCCQTYLLLESNEISVLFLSIIFCSFLLYSFIQQRHLQSWLSWNYMYVSISIISILL